MAGSRRRRNQEQESQEQFGEPVEAEAQEQAASEPETFAEAKGSEANQHAKALSKAKSKEKKQGRPALGSFYTLKGLKKVIRVIVKKSGVHEVYIGNIEKHRDGLAPLIAKWKKTGEWVEAHEVESKINALLGR